jgi:hypothetical protein
MSDRELIIAALRENWSTEDGGLYGKGGAWYGWGQIADVMHDAQPTPDVERLPLDRANARAALYLDWSEEAKAEVERLRTQVAAVEALPTYRTSHDLPEMLGGEYLRRDDVLATLAAQPTKGDELADLLDADHGEQAVLDVIAEASGLLDQGHIGAAQRTLRAVLADEPTKENGDG